MLLSKSEFIYLISIIAFVIVMLLLFFFIVMVLNVKIRKQKEIEKLNAILETQESERNRIAEDLHDEIGPMLSAIKLQISSFLFARDPEVLEKNVAESSGYLDSVIQNVRLIVRNLSPENLSKHGLIQCVEDFRNIIEKNNRIRFSFIDEGINGELHEKAQSNIYRIVTEMINNSLKHSNCNQINLVFKKYEKQFIILYTDNGNLGDDAMISSNGSGIKNISSRVNLMNGQLCTHGNFRQGAFYYIVFDNQHILQPLKA